MAMAKKLKFKFPLMLLVISIVGFSNMVFALDTKLAGAKVESVNIKNERYLTSNFSDSNGDPVTMSSGQISNCMPSFDGSIPVVVEPDQSSNLTGVATVDHLKLIYSQLMAAMMSGKSVDLTLTYAVKGGFCFLSGVAVYK